MMELTTESLQAHIGGQIEIQNPGEGYVFRGKVTTATVTNGLLEVELEWMAKAPYPPSSWKKEDDLTYKASLEIYAAKDIGPGMDGGDTRISLYSQIMGEMVVFYPANGSKLDKSRVEGLD